MDETLRAKDQVRTMAERTTQEQAKAEYWEKRADELSADNARITAAAIQGFGPALAALGQLEEQIKKQEYLSDEDRADMLRLANKVSEYMHKG